MGLLDVLGSIGGGITAFDAAREPGRVSQRNRATAEASAEEERRKRRIEEYQRNLSMIGPSDTAGKARLAQDYADVLGSGAPTTLESLGTIGNLGTIDSEIESTQDVIGKLEILENARDTGNITPEDFATRRAKLNTVAEQEQTRAGTLGRQPAIQNFSDPATQVSPTAFETRRASSQPTSVNFETVNKNARELLRDPKANISDLTDARDRLVKFAGGNVNHPTIKAIENMIPNKTPIEITEDTSSAEVFRKIRERTGKAINASQITRLSEFDTGIASIPDLITAIDQLGTGGFMDAMGPSAGRIASMNPFDEEGQLLAAIFKMTKQLIAKGQEGGVLREGDETKYDFIVPTQKDLPRIAVQKAKNLARQMKRARAIWLQNIASGLTGDEASVSFEELDFTITDEQGNEIQPTGYNYETGQWE